MRNPFVVGVTGGIGSGKSTFSRLLAKGWGTYCDADHLAREATQHPETIAVLRDHFGAAIAPEGRLERKKLGALVFSDRSQLRWLEALLHPKIEALLQERIAQGPWPLIYEATLLFEAHHDRYCQTTVLVTAPREIVLERVALRDGLSTAEIEARLAAQSSAALHTERAAHVVPNDGTLAQLERKILALRSTLDQIYGST